MPDTNLPKLAPDDGFFSPVRAWEADLQARLREFQKNTGCSDAELLALEQDVRSVPFA